MSEYKNLEERNWNMSLRYKVCRGYFSAEALKYCHEERGLTCAGKTLLKKKGVYYHCPDCGWTTVYDLDGEPIGIWDSRDPMEEVEALNRAMYIKMAKKSELARVMGTD